MNYTGLPVLDDYFLEDSWVISVCLRGGSLEFGVQAVLASTHPEFGPPSPGEQHRYGRIVIRFPNVGRTTGPFPLGTRATRDPNGSVDYGNIDDIAREERTTRIGGEWGDLQVESDAPEVLPLESRHYANRSSLRRLSPDANTTNPELPPGRGSA